MTDIVKVAKISALLVVFAVALNGCVTDVSDKSGSHVEGDWADLGNVATSIFRGGLVATISNDSGIILSNGTYKQFGARGIQIEIYSHVRNSNIRINCALVDSNQLNCTTQTGSQFVLTRKKAVG